MRKWTPIIVAIIFSVGCFAAAALLAPQKAGPRQRGSAQKKPASARPAQAARASQAELDEALYMAQDFFGSRAFLERPYSQALDRVSALIARYPGDPRLRLHAARLLERLGREDRAEAEMNKYVELKGRSEDALRRLAAFYQNRARYADQVRALRELAALLPASERAPIYKEAAQIVRLGALKEFKPEDFFAELMSADPTNAQPIKDYVEELILARRYAEALNVLASNQPRFPEELAYFLKARARVLIQMGNRRAAESVYSSAFDPAWPQTIVADYFELLRQLGRYRIVRRDLQKRVREGADDLKSVGALFRFYAYEGNYGAAEELMRQIESRRAAKSAPDGNQAPSGWTLSELETAATMLASIGQYDQASRYLYTLHLAGGLKPGSAERENALYKLFRALVEAGPTATRLGHGNLDLYRDIARVDQSPSFFGGVLSLILANTNPEDKFAVASAAAAGYFNRAMAYRIFSAFKREYAQSSRLSQMYLDALNLLADSGEPRLMIELGAEFQRRFPDSPHYAEVSLRIADAHLALKDRTGERAVLAELLDRLARAKPKSEPLVPASPKRWRYGATSQIEAYSDVYDPTESGYDEPEAEHQQDHYVKPAARRSPTYSSVLERYIASLAAEDKKTEIVKLFWSEIKKHPKEEGLYERFLQWLGRSGLISEQLSAYQAAIRQFNSNTWYHRLARWYVRQKRGRELLSYSRQLIQTLDEEEVTEYLARFAGHGATPHGDRLDWDERLAFELYSLAHKRFPRNLFFVRGMLAHLEKHNPAAWGKLAAEFYFADQQIRDSYLRWLSKQGLLRDRYAEARSKEGDLGYKIFAADAAAWLSHHEQAIETYAQLVKLYPGEPRYANRLADLARSAGQYELAAQVLKQMADIYPTDHAYRIKAGEIYAQMGDMARAGREWEKLTELEPGERNTYLEVATVYWDYYQFDQAIEVLKRLRRVTGDPAIYAYRLGALYEGRGDWDLAISEYVKVLAEPGQGRDIAAARLAQLARRGGLPEKIESAYRRAVASNPNDWQLHIGYAQYLAKRDMVPEALALLRGEASRSADVAFLESIRELFGSSLRPEDEHFVLERLVAAARDERESIGYRLQLALWLERRNRAEAAKKIIDSLTADHPTNAGVIEESEKFYWRAGFQGQSFDLLKRSLELARGSNRRNLALILARRQIEAGQLDQAEATLRKLYEGDRSDAEAFSELARVLADEGKMEELVALYKLALRESQGRERQAEIRSGMIRALDQLGKREEALSEHIQILNLSPEEEARLVAALSYAEQNNLVDKLTSYYEKLSRESYKDYRWQLVLGRIYEWIGNISAARERYRAALALEPQRNDIRKRLALALAREQNYDQALAVLRQGWLLSNRDPSWLIEIARIQARQEQVDQAARALREALSAKKDPQYQLTIANAMAELGLAAEAARAYERAFAELLKALSEQGSTVAIQSIPPYVRALVQLGPSAALSKLEGLRRQLAAIAENSQDADKYKAERILSALDAAMREDLGREARDRWDAQQMAALASAIRAATSKLNSYSYRQELLRYAGIARGAGLSQLEEEIYLRIKDMAFGARTDPNDTRCYDELRALISFYDGRAQFLRAAQVLTAQAASDTHKGLFNYEAEIALRYRMSGDLERELEWLRLMYNSASGNLTSDYSDQVERYLTLLHQLGRWDELEQLANKQNPHQLQLINFLIEKGQRRLALKAISASGQSPAWIASRSGEVGLFLEDKSEEFGEFFRRALDTQPIGALINRASRPPQSLTGEDWFLAARNYGYWLSMAGKPEATRWLAGEIEGRPTNALSQLELAAFYLERNELNRAEAHIGLAAELAPDDVSLRILRGKIELKRGRKREALEAWKSIISRPSSQPADAETYLKVMSDSGFFAEALPQLESFMIAYGNRAMARDRASPEEIKPLVRQIASQALQHKAVAEAATTLSRIVSHLGEDFSIGQMIVEEELLPEAHLGAIYRTVHQRLEDLAAQLEGTPEYEGGYSVDGRYIYPAAELSRWRKRLLDYLIRNGSLGQARLLIQTIKREQSQLRLALEDVTDHYDWLPLADALIKLRSNDLQGAMRELRRYVQDPQQEKRLKAHALLLAEGQNELADSLLYEAYLESLGSGDPSERATALSGLAQIEARRGQIERATKRLESLAAISDQHLQLAAETATRAGLIKEAIAYRERFALAHPQDATNRLELARLISTSKQNLEALRLLVKLELDQSTPNSVKAQAAEILHQIARDDKSIVTQAQASAEDLISRKASLAGAALLEGLGQIDRARAALAEITGPLEPIAQFKLSQMAISKKEAIEHLERAIYLDPDGQMTDKIAFSTSAAARTKLALLYAGAGRELAALRITGADGALQVKSALSPLDREVEPEPAAIFEQAFALQRSRDESKLRTIAELNDLATMNRAELIEALAEAALRLRLYDLARSIQRTRLLEASEQRERKAALDKLTQIEAQARAGAARARPFRISRANASDSVYIGRALSQ
jgi:tetratricopeptide (TPR) repeat protein